MNKTLLRKFLEPSEMLFDSEKNITGYLKNLEKLELELEIHKNKKYCSLDDMYGTIEKIDQNIKINKENELNKSIDLYKNFFNDNSFPFEKWIGVWFLDIKILKNILEKTNDKNSIRFTFNFVNYLNSLLKEHKDLIFKLEYIKIISSFYDFVYSNDIKEIKKSPFYFLLIKNKKVNINNIIDYKNSLIYYYVNKDKKYFYHYYMLSIYYDNQEYMRYLSNLMDKDKKKNNCFYPSILNQQKQFFIDTHKSFLFNLLLNRFKLNYSFGKEEHETILYQLDKNKIQNELIELFLIGMKKTLVDYDINQNKNNLLLINKLLLEFNIKLNTFKNKSVNKL